MRLNRQEMARKAQDVTDAELAILQLLWERGESTAPELTRELYPAETNSDLATVQKLLRRLEGKSCVRRNSGTWPHVFKPALKREELIGRRVQSAADALCAGSVGTLLTHLVKTKKLSTEDRTALRELLDELDTGEDQKTRKRR